MINDKTKIEMPPDLEWEDVGDAPNTHLGATVQMWGITFYIDAFAIDESGEALCPSGARLLKLVRLIDGYEVGAFYKTVELRPGLNYMIVFTPGRSSASDPRLYLPILQVYAEHPEGLTDRELAEILNQKRLAGPSMK